MTEKNDANPMEKLATESTHRMEQMIEDYKKFESQQQQKAMEMIDEGAKMMKASVEYGMKMSEEWRRLALQANRQATELFTTRWF
ncbi:MAG: hypothetical protein AAFU79_26220 [Myxococcota bacterium]